MQKRFIVHSYYAMQPVQEKEFDSEDKAVRYARDKWKNELETTNLYKIKVWDLKKGSIVPNVSNAAGLVFELV